MNIATRWRRMSRRKARKAALTGLGAYRGNLPVYTAIIRDKR